MSNLLRSYADGPRIWDAVAVLPDVHDLIDRGMIEPVPGGGRAYQLTAAGRAELGGLTDDQREQAWAFADELHDHLSSAVEQTDLVMGLLRKQGALTQEDRVTIERARKMLDTYTDDVRTAYEALDGELR